MLTRLLLNYCYGVGCQVTCFVPKALEDGRKNSKTFFSDMKLPRSQRAKVPLLVAPEGILWVGGLREDERFQVSTTTTSVVTATLTL